MMQSKRKAHTKIRIGTRGSKLALAQAHEVRGKLMAAHGLKETDFEIYIIKTSGDNNQHTNLSEIGGKGLFTKEIEEALLEKRIDLAVHSMKDVATKLPAGLVLECFLPREDVCDAFISTKAKNIAELPRGAVMGTSSLRRQAQVKRLRPDLKIVPFRGNVETRLRKLRDGVADATLLACAGLKRLGKAKLIASPVCVNEMIPAVAQGAIGIEVREGDEHIKEFIASLHDEVTAVCVTTERAFLAELDGSCRTPVGGLAELHEGRLHLRGEILTPDGAVRHATEREGMPEDGVAMGVDAARELLGLAGPGFFCRVA
jgi:hydroxymethylbilane synthase